jgi:hypothetical protein
MAAAALDAAFEDEAPQERSRSRHPVRAIAAGVVLAGAARVALTRASALRELGTALKATNSLREAPERIRDGLGDRFADLRDRVGDLAREGTDGGNEVAEAEDSEEREDREEEPEAQPAGEADAGESEGSGEEPEAPDAPADDEDAGEASDEADEPPETADDEEEASGEAGEPQEGADDEAEESESSAGDDLAEELEPEEEGDAERGPLETLDALVAEDREQPGNPGSSRPDVLSVLSAPREPPPVLSRLATRGRRAAPTDRPPVPPDDGSGSRRRSKSGRGERAGKR